MQPSLLLHDLSQASLESDAAFKARLQILEVIGSQLRQACSSTSSAHVTALLPACEAVTCPTLLWTPLSYLGQSSYAV